MLGASLLQTHALEALLTNDSTIFSGSSAATYGDGTTQLVNSTSTKCSILRFEIATMLPTGVTADNIATATLRVFSTVAPTGTGSVDIYTILAGKSWNEGNATGAWTAGTDYESTAVLSGVSVNNFALNDYTALDINSAFKAWITTPNSDNGLILRPSGTVGLTFSTKENINGGHNAVLEITVKGDVGENATYENTLYGVETLPQNTTGYSNIGVGYKALYSNTTGYSNVANGYQSLLSNIDGYENVAIGCQAVPRTTPH